MPTEFDNHITMEHFNDFLGGPPNVNEALTSNAYFELIPEEVSVIVNVEDMMEVEAAALLFHAVGPDDVDNDHQSLSSTSSDIGDEPIPQLDIMLTLQRWNIDDHVSRHAMSGLLSILKDAGHEELPKDWWTVLNRCALEDAALRDNSGAGRYHYGGPADTRRRSHFSSCQVP